MSTPSYRTATLDNVSTLTLYELRQNLDARNAYDEARDGRASFKLFLKLCVEMLVDDQKKKEAEEARVKEAEDAGKETLQERLARQKAERKRAAMERSKARQQQPGYFEKKTATDTELNSNLTPKQLAERDAAAENKELFALGGLKMPVKLIK
tara:strand:+ start:468 stop:926 length:459 start_codon:yes stop_codon:yes gene_type:complete